MKVSLKDLFPRIDVDDDEAVRDALRAVVNEKLENWLADHEGHVGEIIASSLHATADPRVTARLNCHTCDEAFRIEVVR